MTMAKRASVRSGKSKASFSKSSTRPEVTKSDSSQRDERLEKSAQPIVRRTLAEARTGKTDWDRLRSMSDEEVLEGIRSDPDADETDAEFWRDAVFVEAPTKEAISIRVDKDVLDWFRSFGRGYQTKMNAVLRAFMEAKAADRRRG